MSERIDTGSRTLHVVRRGTGEPLLLIQGMSGTHASWGEKFLSGLDEGFSSISYDHRGIGRSDPAPEAFSIVDLAQDAIDLLDALELESAHVMGISMGGMVAQELVLGHPQRVRSLTLGCTYSGGEGASLASPETIQRLAQGMMSGDRELALRTGYEINLSPAFVSDEANWAPFYEMATTTPAAIATIMLQMQAINVHDTLARLATVTTPTLVIHGDADQMIPVSNARLIAGAIPGAALEVLPGVGHMFWWEQPERSAALIREHALGVAAG
jgi:pimeloyl-ACP methyl ester carboxylesterase